MDLPKLRLLLCSIAVCLLFIVNSGCEKYIKRGHIEGGLALTFDDNYIDNWYSYLNMLDSFGAKATFYISSYQALTSIQKQKLKVIEQRGHEIAFHTTHHLNLPKYLTTHTLKETLDKEIYAGLHAMNNDGFYPRNFAYPYGRHTVALDSALLKIFSSVRTLNGTPDYTKSVCKTYGNKRLRSLNIDNDGLPLNKLLNMLNCASDNSNCVVLLAHRIMDGQNIRVSPERLRAILTKAKELKLRFYLVKELARQ